MAALSRRSRCSRRSRRLSRSSLRVPHDMPLARRADMVTVPPNVAIVDGYSTGRFIAGELRRRGAAAIHVTSQPDMPDYFAHGFRAEDYDVCIECCGDRERVAK